MGRSESNRNLVILGAGYVGSALAIAARGSGWVVSALTRNQDRIETLERLGIAAIQARTDEPGWESMMPTEVQGVVYCASSASRSVEGYRASYIDGQERALRWAQAAGVKHYIYTSSTSVYGEAMGEWVDEDSGPWSDTEYARVLLEAEKRVLSSAVRAT
ncbi:MAG: NAD-dependent epimerase/dehydratase family protein, partial [Verrucomicrobiota bacterium]